MKDKEKKHKGESTIGKIIYGFMLFLPLFAIGSTILLNTFQSTEQKNIDTTYDYQTNDVNSVEDFVRGNIYHFHYEKLDTANEYICRCQAIYLTDNNVTNAKYLVEKSNSYFNIRVSGSNWQIDVFNANNASSLGRTNSTSRNIDFDFVYEDETYIDFDKFEYSKSENTHIIEYTETGINRSDIFYYSVNQVENSNLFNWATNTAIYTGILATANTLGITNTFIPMLMTYWLIISVLYFLYDIILMGLNILHKKIHELQESI